MINLPYQCFKTLTRASIARQWTFPEMWKMWLKFFCSTLQMCAKLHSDGKQPLCDVTDTLLTQLVIDAPSLPDKLVLVHLQACGSTVFPYTVEDKVISPTMKYYISLRIFKQSKPDWSMFGTRWREIIHSGSVSCALMTLNWSSLVREKHAYARRIKGRGI